MSDSERISDLVRPNHEEEATNLDHQSLNKTPSYENISNIRLPPYGRESISESGSSDSDMEEEKPEVTIESVNIEQNEVNPETHKDIASPSMLSSTPKRNSTLYLSQRLGAASSLAEMHKMLEFTESNLSIGSGASSGECSSLSLDEMTIENVINTEVNNNENNQQEGILEEESQKEVLVESYEKHSNDTKDIANNNANDDLDDDQYDEFAKAYFKGKIKRDSIAIGLIRKNLEIEGASAINHSYEADEIDDGKKPPVSPTKVHFSHDYGVKDNVIDIPINDDFQDVDKEKEEIEPEKEHFHILSANIFRAILCYMLVVTILAIILLIVVILYASKVLT